MEVWKERKVTLMIRSPVWTPARIAAPSTTHTPQGWGDASVRERSKVNVSPSLLTFFDQLHKDGIVSTHSQPETIFISLDDHTALDQA